MKRVSFFQYCKTIERKRQPSRSIKIPLITTKNSLSNIGNNLFPLFCICSAYLNPLIVSAAFTGKVHRLLHTNQNRHSYKFGAKVIISCQSEKKQFEQIHSIRSFSKPKYSKNTFAMSTSTVGNDKDDKSIGNVIVVGSANQDLVAYTPRLPIPGETILGNSFETFCGGKGANQAVAAASLGFSPVSIICKVGNDSFGKVLLSNFRKLLILFSST